MIQFKKTNHFIKRLDKILALNINAHEIELLQVLETGTDKKIIMLNEPPHFLKMLKIILP